MRMALEEARKGRYIAPPNPAVGCVLVRDGQIIARGHTHAPGSRHAEVDAIENALAAGISVEGATAYVTLEPCSHYGRTPPCALRLIKEKIRRVVVGVLDPNPLVAGRGVAMLREAGVEVLTGVLEKECFESNIGFLTRMKTGLPWVRMKVAASLDGRTALANGLSQWITGPSAREDGQRLRARAQGLLTGIGTVLADDPQMNVRCDASLPSPAKYIFDTRARTPVTARILQGAPATVFVGTDAWDADVRALENAGARVVALPLNANGHIELASAVKAIGDDAVNELHVEAGAGLNGGLLAAGLVDEIVCYAAPAMIGRGPGWANLPEFRTMDEIFRWHFHEVLPVGEDLRIVLRKTV